MKTKQIIPLTIIATLLISCGVHQIDSVNPPVETPQVKTIPVYTKNINNTFINPIINKPINKPVYINPIKPIKPIKHTHNDHDYNCNCVYCVYLHNKKQYNINNKQYNIHNH